MTNPIKVKRSDPSAAVALGAFPDYRGRKISIEVHQEPYGFSFPANYWDGGTRSYYVMASLRPEGGSLPVPDAHPTFRPATAAMLEDGSIPKDAVIVEHIIFCGKDLGLRIHARADNMIPLLPEVTA